MMIKVPRYQAHRGFTNKSKIHENTLEALISARKAGFAGAEVDVRSTAGGEVILHHDHTLERIYGLHTEVRDLTLADIRRHGITRLEEVLLSTEVPDFLNIEIKNTSFIHFQTEEALAQLFERLKGKIKKEILFSSFNPLSLLKMQHLLPERPRALLVSFQKEPGNPIYLRRRWFEPLLDIQFLHAHYQGFTRSQLYEYNRQGIQVALWTVNNKSESERWLSSGVASVITDEVLHE